MINTHEDLTVFRVGDSPVDALITQWCASEPLQHLYQSWRTTIRALIWVQPSREWRWIVAVPPMPSRMGLLRNPIFANLVRDWALHLKVFGLDQQAVLRDFSPLLSDDLLSKLLSALSTTVSDRTDSVLDVILSAFERHTEHTDESDGQLLTTTVPLLTHGIFAGNGPNALLAHVGLYPDLSSALKNEVRLGTMTQAHYVRTKASLDLRESIWINALLARLKQDLSTGALEFCTTRHHALDAGLYNWHCYAHQYRPHRRNFLSRLPLFGRYASDILLPLCEPASLRQYSLQRATLCGCRLGSNHTMETHLAEDLYVQRAIDSGQDRLVISALSERFKVRENTLRTLWRQRSPTPSIPPWQLSPLLERLNDLPERAWPDSSAKWALWLSHTLPRND